MNKTFSAAALAGLLFSSLSWAQATTVDTAAVIDALPAEEVPAPYEPDLSDFYLVEITIFTNTKAENADEELWPRELQLEYLAPLAVLDQQSPEALYPELVSAPVTEEENLETAAEEPATSGTDAEEQTPEDEETVVLPSILLPAVDDSYQQHQDYVKRIERSSRHKLLLHTSWLQKLGSADDAPNIILQAGEKAAEQQQLGGTIKLYKERYLHLKTNLWLVDYIAAAVEELEISEPETESLIEATPVSESLSLTDEPMDLEATETEPLIEELPWPLPPELEVSVTDESEETESTATEEQSDSSEPLIALDLTEPEINRIVLMQQKRRMRSLELHYIDHPLFGVLIELRPYKLHLEQAAAENN